MRVLINKAESEAISKAWESINEKLEGCDGGVEEESELQSILKGLKSLETKLKKSTKS